MVEANYYCEKCTTEKGLEVDQELYQSGYGGYCDCCGVCDVFYSMVIIEDG